MEPYRKTIKGHDYEVTPFMGIQGWRLQLKLAKIIGPTIREGLAALPKGEISSILDGEVNVSALGGAVAGFIQAVTEADPNGDLVTQMLSTSQRDGQLLTEGAINKCYAANYGELILALLAVVEANDFFGIASFGLGEGLAKLAGTTAGS